MVTDLKVCDLCNEALRIIFGSHFSILETTLFQASVPLQYWPGY